MRTIKFRGKRYGDGAWVYGNLYQGTKEGEQYSIILDDAGYDLAPEDDRNLAIAFAENEVNVVFPDTVGQFTGLLDKNGKEIYEGDVLQRIPNEQYSDATGIPLDMLREDIGEGGDLVFVRYDESQSSVMYLSLSRKFNVHWLNTQYFTIIGNIHDTPNF